ncbi:MAG: general stress protein CsbD [Bacteroidales bacterium]|nr:general stress protein CsbD [Bacteroidales bacterium]
MKDNVTGYWNWKKEKLKQKYAIITDEDLCFSDGKEKEMMERLGYKLGKSKAELVYIIAAL